MQLKVVVLNRRKIGLTFLLVGIVIILFGISKNFDKQLDYVGTKYFYKTVDVFNTYNSNTDSFKYNLPKGYMATEVVNGGSDIISKINFHSKDNDVSGNIEVSKYEGDIEDIVRNEVSYENTKTTTYTSNGEENYKLEYSFVSNGDELTGIEFYKLIDSRLYKASFILKNYDEATKQKVEDIYAGIKIN